MGELAPPIEVFLEDTNLNFGIGSALNPAPSGDTICTSQMSW